MIIATSFTMENETANYADWAGQPEKTYIVNSPRYRLELTMTTEGVEALKKLCARGIADKDTKELARKLLQALP